MMVAVSMKAGVVLTAGALGVVAVVEALILFMLMEEDRVSEEGRRRNGKLSVSGGASVRMQIRIMDNRFAMFFNAYHLQKN